METLSSIESFVRSAEAGSFSAAARFLGLTPAAVSKNVAILERNLGVRLFQRSTRRLTLTEAGERFLLEVSGGLDAVQSAIANMTRSDGEPSGTLKISLATAFGREYILPLLGEFLARYPAIQPDWRFDNRQVDLIGEGIDVAIGGGIELTPGVIARELARAHLVLVASPAYLADKKIPKMPADLHTLDGIMRRSSNSGRIQPWQLRTRTNEQVTVELKARAIMNDPEALCCAAAMHLGVAFAPLPHVMPYLDGGRLVQLLPKWFGDVGPISIYFASQKLLPAKTRAFVDFVVEHFRREQLAKKFSAIK